jgi:N-acetyl-gamma-glutamyl-phosphate reductase
MTAASRTRIGIAGATGYAGRELLVLLARHPGVEIVSLVHGPGEPDELISTTFPQLAGLCDLPVENAPAILEAARLDAVFLALPHRAAMALAKPLLAKGIRVIDFSADYRLRDVAIYEHWYGVKHEDRENLVHAVYGLCEHYRPQIKTARLLANPGCYTSCAMLPLIPLLKAGLINPDTIIVDAKSGTSGAGRKPAASLHFVEVNESFKAYGVFNHRHRPEIEQELSVAAGRPVEIIFTPHLLPIERGILSTIYVDLNPQTTSDDIGAALTAAYGHEFFVRLKPMGAAVELKHVNHTNFCDIAWHVAGRKAIITSALDNLVKGAAGQALQNFNIMFGFDEKTGLV